MSFLSKVELKRQLKAMGIKVEGNYVKKKDFEKILAMSFLKRVEVKAINFEFPLFRVQKNSVQPTVRSQATYDPAGIYFFFKNERPEGGVYWSDWEFSFEARLTHSAKVLRIDQIAQNMVEKWLGELIDLDSHDVLVDLCDVMVEQENWDADHYAELAANEPDATVRSWIMKRAFWYHILKAHFNDSMRFAQFFLSKSFNVLEDHNATIWNTEKDQLIVLKKSAVEIRSIEPDKIREICGS